MAAQINSEADSLQHEIIGTIASIYEEKSEKKVNDIKRSNGDLDKFRRYLNCFHSIKAADPNKEEWQQINKYRLIRNAIIHNASRLKKDKNLGNLTGFLELYQVIVIEESNQFDIRNENFFLDFICISRKYMEMYILEIEPL